MNGRCHLRPHEKCLKLLFFLLAARRRIARLQERPLIIRNLGVALNRGRVFGRVFELDDPFDRWCAQESRFVSARLECEYTGSRGAPGTGIELLQQGFF